MPNTQSAKKALRQNEARRAKNLSVKRVIRKTIREFKDLVESGQTADAETKLSTVYKTLDKAAKVGVIKKNKSSRLKSRLATQLKKASSPEPSATEGQA